MLFSSITFLFYFLPLLLLVYFITPKKYRNIILLIFSLIFYFYGEPKLIIFLILSSIINYIASKYMNKPVLILALIYNIGQLIYFKYTNFFIGNINSLLNSNISYLNIIMPIGISFYTFQNISYIIDVYKKDVKPCNKFINYACYICLFPQLVAGPIVRYKTINNELTNRKESYDLFSSGCYRFVIGLAKKVIIANSIGELIGSITLTSTLGYIIVAICYTLQIYFDFSGYSDMAIGLGSMFGFKFNENFNYPLMASSITNFWRRWHISLSSFFKDYIYIPLGGNRVSFIKWIRNIFIVWFLTGFWHGASWNFIIWGLYFAILLVLEKRVYGKYLDKTKVLKYIYTTIFVVISFVIFNMNSIGDIISYLKGMTSLKDLPLIDDNSIYYLRSYIILLIISIIGSTPLIKKLLDKVEVIKPVYMVILLIIVTSYLIDSSFNPFLYFRF